MRAPAFWWPSQPTLAARFLQPIGALYGGITAQRMRLTGIVPTCPVICVGNFIAGGAGKTPTAIALAQRLVKLNHSVSFLTRGYGGRLSGPVFIANNGHASREFTHIDVGDEPLLLARHAPVMVARDRRAGLEELLAHEKARSDIVIMDDGLQNPSIVKTLTFAVVDARTGLGNGLCIPAGPLRAPLLRQLSYVDALIVIGSGEAGNRVAEAALAKNKPVFSAYLEPTPDSARLVRGKRVLAFAGIGRPEKFFETLESLGAEIVKRRAFADHTPFTSGQIVALEEEALRDGLLLVTTEKDAVRLLTINEAPRFQDSMVVLSVNLRFNAEEDLQAYLTKKIESIELNFKASSL